MILGCCADIMFQFKHFRNKFVCPLYARAAKDNLGSLKVLERCGFKITGEDSGYANARGKDVEEFIFTLNQ